MTMSVTRVLEDDPELAERLSPQERAAVVDAAVARVETLRRGVWTEPDDPVRYRDGFGLLVLDGVLARRVNLERFECTELLGRGDVLRPWTFEGATLASVPTRVSWTVLEPVRMAALDRRFSLAVAHWPE